MTKEPCQRVWGSGPLALRPSLGNLAGQGMRRLAAPTSFINYHQQQA